MLLAIMKKHLIITVCIVLVAILLCVVGYAWSLGTVDTVAPLTTHIEVLKGTAELKKSNADKAISVTGTSTVLEVGDTVKAGEDSQVEVVWGDQGVTRLENGSEIVIESAPDFQSEETAAISIKLTAGRIWSRMVKVLDLDKPMQVRAGDVVATVRGTTYGVALEGDDTMIVVDESVVSYARDNENETMVADLQAAFVGDGGKTDVIESAEQNAWRLEQQQNDFRFDQRYAEWMFKRETKQSQRIKNAPRALINLGERMRLATAGSKKKAELAASYARRSVALAIVDPTKADTAMNAMMARMDKADKNGKKVARELNAMQSFMNRTNLDGPKDFGVRTPSASLMKKMRTQRKSLAKLDIDQLYRDTLDIDEDIDQLLYMSDDRRDADITIARLLERIDTIDDAIKKLKDPKAKELEKKLAALRKRLERWFDIKASKPIKEDDNKKDEVTIEEPKDIPGIPGSKPTSIKPPKEVINEPAPTTRIYQRLELVPTPSSLTLNERTTVRAFGIRPDGAVDDITSQVRFAPRYSGDGVFVGNVFKPAITGIISLNGTFVDPQGARTAAVSISVTDGSTAINPNELVSIALVTTSPTNVSCGVTIPFKVIGTYGDGTKQDVTVKASYATSDSKLAYVGDAKVSVFCPIETSTATITARVTEGAVTKSGSMMITVTPDPISNTGRPNGNNYPFTYVP